MKTIQAVRVAFPGSPNLYTYFCPDPVQVGDLVEVDARGHPMQLAVKSVLHIAPVVRVISEQEQFRQQAADLAFRLVDDFPTPLALAEEIADELKHREWLDNPGHWLWDVVADELSDHQTTPEPV